MCYSYIVNNPCGPSSDEYSCERLRDSREFLSSARVYSLPCSWAVPYKHIDSEFMEKFLLSIYDNDVSFGSDGVQCTYYLYQKAKSRLKEGRFHLWKFITNSGVALPDCRQWIVQQVLCQWHSGEGGRLVLCKMFSWSKGSCSWWATQDSRYSVGLHTWPVHLQHWWGCLPYGKGGTQYAKCILCSQDCMGWATDRWTPQGLKVTVCSATLSGLNHCSTMLSDDHNWDVSDCQADTILWCLIKSIARPLHNRSGHG